MALNLLPRQPLEIAQSKRIALDISLAGHDSALHDEGLLSGLGDDGLRVDEWLGDDVADWDMAYDPGVHVHTTGLDENALCCLK